MEMGIHLVLLLAGFVLLIKGADYFVEGSSSVAGILKVPGIVIGLTIVAMGTSAPELAVSISAGLKGANELAVSNVIGSNLFNLLVVLGVCGLIHPIPVGESVRKKEFPLSIISAGVLLILIADKWMLWGDVSAVVSSVHVIDGIIGNISRIDALILLAIFLFFMYSTISGAMKDRKSETEVEEFRQMSMIKSVVFVVGGIGAIVLGGNVVVDHASAIARMAGMSDTLVGLTIVAIGTSLPELVTSIVASRKGKNDIAVGNVVGSNLFNILCILGISGVIHPIKVTLASVIDLVVLIAASLITYFFVVTQKKLDKKEGLILLLMYIVYTIYIIMR